MANEVPALPYDYEALEPYIDSQTMHLHHDKHHERSQGRVSATQWAERSGEP